MKKYNLTQLNPEIAFEKHIYHRDMFAHYLRWSHILKETKIGDSIIDFGCGNGNLLEVLYRNKIKCQSYIGIDIRKSIIDKNKETYKNVIWANFICEDLINPTIDLSKLYANRVCSFEVLEHVGKQNIDKFLQNFKSCGGGNTIYYLSTPNYDEEVGAAENHTYDSLDGRGKAVQEFSYQELKPILEKYFNIEKIYGTFASQKDYKPLMNEWQLNMFNVLKEYYDTNLLSNIMAPMFPEQSRNILYILKQNKEIEIKEIDKFWI